MFVINSKNPREQNYIIPETYRSLAIETRNAGHWTEYNGSLLNMRDNLQFALAWYPLFLNNFEYYVHTHKPNYNSYTAFLQNFEYRIKAMLTRTDTEDCPTEYLSHKLINFIIINVDGSHDINDIFNYLDNFGAPFVNNKMLNTAVMLNAGNHIRVYINQETNRVLVFTDVLNPGFMLKLLSILPAAMTDLNPELNQFEYNFPVSLFMLLNTLNYDEYMSAFTDWWTPVQEVFAKKQMMHNLKTYFNNRRTNEQAHIDATINGLLNEIVQYEDALRIKYNNVNNQRKQMMYYLCHDIDDLINEFIQYVENKVSNKKDIINITYSSNSIYIEVFVPLSNYAVDEVEALYDAPSNYMNGTDEMRAISKHVLINQDYQIMIQQQFRWNLVDKTVARGEDSYTPTKGMPNPHIQGFGCWGNNKSLIQKALADARLIIALEQSISAIRGINVSDSAVMKRWRDYMLARRPEYTDTPAFKNMETGELLNLQQFMDQITERENNNNVETDQPELVLTDDEGAVPPQL